MTSYRVDTATTDGMHRVVAIGVATPDGAAHPAALTEAELAVLRSAVRGRLDQLGHEAGPAVTVVAMIDARPHIVSCRPVGA
ncbi:hypothetical protein QEZ54_27850 [Catellatospora sp. KI3]|uniref:hypothetical protein n=1 Tax=Catellatospora sp. KI3 TaxID=3041620 RepID=UPI0024831887|nr:hypothetical protein [Catellatospora sp. KI3]MDI1464791.1 hypothetical protein [Catellatospora sp. KI3]